MKKNTMMRIASFLLIAVLLSTSAISGTYAKYVTKDEGTDSARVAKFGVTVEIVGASSFATEYASHDTSKYASATVLSSDTKKVVAPGTSSADVAGDVTFKITGTPEVATWVDIKFEAKKDIYLGVGTYGDPTTTDGTDTFGVTTEYHPVVFTLTSDIQGVIKTGTLKEIETEFNKLTKAYGPNVTLDETFTLTWEWPYGVFDGISYEDRCDTTLGNIAAQAGWHYNGATDYSTELEYALTITVTQID